jgi:ElaB/YqjD/DUF883 family membrane-anchored ribosome-binding protein
MATEGTERLVADLQDLAADTQALINETVGQGSERAVVARERAKRALANLQGSIASLQDVALERAREAAAATEDYVRQNPWRSLGTAATVAIAVGVIAGILLGRR